MGNPVPDNDENVKLCLCPTCPTYKESKLSNSVFCAKGKSKETPKTVGCICPNCSVFTKYALDQMYYCAKGKSVDLKE